uniref:Uncharacterized protein n=1 Tax=Brassica oleracea TaxID=3712 RepID=A0A3P6C4Q7_BRAOL|nr:unnamed protein product [Brassica oleracea]
MKLPMGGATPPAQNAIESFSVDFRHSHVHTAITTTQLEFSGQIPLGFVAFDGDMTKQTNSCAEEIARLTHFKTGYPDLRPLPQCLKDLVGTTITLDLKLSPSNFS